MATIVLTGGGTAGHVTPNIALIPILREHFDKIIYIGSDLGPERELVSQFRDIEFYAITTTKLLRKVTLKNLLIPFRFLEGRAQAKKILKKAQPDVIFSKGGFVSLPVVFAGKALKIPMVAHESDLSLGLANRITRKNFHTICTTFSETADSLPNGLYVGAPYQKKNFTAAEQTKIRRELNLNNMPICLILGGSQGASAINNLVTDNLTALTRTHQIIHITGHGKLNKLIKKPNYHPIEYTSDLAILMSMADIAITRGGSNMIFELLSYNVPMLIIPLSKGSRGDQIENARNFTKKGYALMQMEENLDSKLFLERFGDLVAAAPKIRAVSKHALPTDGLQKIVATILKCKK